MRETTIARSGEHVYNNSSQVMGSYCPSTTYVYLCNTDAEHGTYEVSYNWSSGGETSRFTKVVTTPGRANVGRDAPQLGVSQYMPAPVTMRAGQSVRDVKWDLVALCPYWRGSGP